MNEFIRPVPTSLVWAAGASWAGVEGTDRRLVTSLAQAGSRVVWIEPPGVHRSVRPARSTPRRTRQQGIDVRSVPVLPGFSRPIIRRHTAQRMAAAINDAALGLRPGDSVVVASPHAVLPERSDVVRALYLTDDWVAGAEMMGLSRPTVRRALQTNLARADHVLAVSSELVDRAKRWARAGRQGDSNAQFHVLGNGTGAAVLDPSSDESTRAGAVLVGQINERTDLGFVEAVARRGIALSVVGPLTSFDRGFRSRWTRLVEASPNIEWHGRVPASEVASFLAKARVGLTPYVPSAFNMASCPLKTYEYLASGLLVVSSVLPASLSIGDPAVRCARTADEFAAAVDAQHARYDASLAERSRQIARQNSWTERAAALRGILAS